MKLKQANGKGEVKMRYLLFLRVIHVVRDVILPSFVGREECRL